MQPQQSQDVAFVSPAAGAARGQRARILPGPSLPHHLPRASQPSLPNERLRGKELRALRDGVFVTQGSSSPPASVSPALPGQLGALAVGRTEPYQPLRLLSHPRADSTCSSRGTTCATQHKDTWPSVLGKGGGGTFLPPLGLKDHYKHNIFLWGEKRRTCGAAPVLKPH